MAKCIEWAKNWYKKHGLAEVSLQMEYCFIYWSRIFQKNNNKSEDSHVQEQ